jgi:hypothetical protein
MNLINIPTERTTAFTDLLLGLRRWACLFTFSGCAAA